MTFIDKVKNRGMIFDGAMGTMLIREGLGGGKASEFWTLEKPEIVQAIHRAYFDAGADIVTTNTFGGTTLKLKKTGLEKHADTINTLSAQLARAAATNGKFVAGDIGPLGELLEPSGTIPVEMAVETFAAQAEALASAGVDAIIIETMFDLEEALAAIKGIQSVSSLPILATLTFQRIPNGFATMMGNRVEISMKSLRDAGAFAVGANCSIGSDAMVDLAREIRGWVDIPVIIQPNAGIPEIRGLETVYPESVDYFSRNIRIIQSEGIEIVGGCCGTDPDYIRAITQYFHRN